MLNSVQDRFEVNITELPDEIDVSSYSKWLFLSQIMFSRYIIFPNLQLNKYEHKDGPSLFNFNYFRYFFVNIVIVPLILFININYGT